MDHDVSADRAAPTGLTVERIQPSYAQVADQLRTLIFDGQLVPGERLPPEWEIAARFGVSRSTTREALQVLATEGLLETRRGSTRETFVLDHGSGDADQALHEAARVAAGGDAPSVEEIIELWEMTQVRAAVLAARRRNDADLQALRRLSAPPTGGRDGSTAQLAARALEFHSAVLAATGNRLLRSCGRRLTDAAANALIDEEQARSFVLAATDRHRRIADAIARHDESAARAEMAADMVEPVIHHALNSTRTLQGEEP